LTPEKEPPIDLSKLTQGQLWASLRKCWKAYRIAKVQADKEVMKKYALRIVAIQDALKVPHSIFEVLQLDAS
jgi:hypothetical protein